MNISVQEFYSVALATSVAIAAGLMGSYALMKRMTLAGDTMSHIALPGLGLAILWGINPVIGGAAALAIGAILIWRIESATDLATETTIGVIFSAALALGALVTPSEDIIDALFGGYKPISGTVFAIYILLSVLVILWAILNRDKLIVSLFNSDLASVSKVNVSRLNLMFLLMFALTLILGLRFLGALLVGSLVIIPAAVSRQLTHTLTRFLSVSAAVSALSVFIGYGLGALYHVQETRIGPLVISVAAAMFLLSLFKKKN